MELLHFVTFLANASEEPQGIAALGIDPVAILAQAATFLLLFWIIKKFALNKIVDTLEKRRKTIDDGVRLGRKMEAEHAKLEEDIEKQLKQARIEADQIIADSHQEAGSILKQAEDTARHKADVLLQEAHTRIEEDIQRAREGLEQEVRELVAETTAVIAEEKLDAKKDMNMIERALNRVRSA